MDNLFPSFLKKLNINGAASNALIFNASIKQIAFMISLFSSNVYLIITNSAATLMLLPYILLFLDGVRCWRKIYYSNTSYLLNRFTTFFI